MSMVNVHEEQRWLDLMQCTHLSMLQKEYWDCYLMWHFQVLVNVVSAFWY